MLTTNSSLNSAIEPRPLFPAEHYNSQSSLISSSSLLTAIDKAENTHVSGFKLITRRIKSTVSSVFNRMIKKITRNNVTMYSEAPQLIGTTIHPHIASKYQDKIDFSGVGVVNALKSTNIKREDYNVLVNNIIRPLNETPQITKESIKTPGEIIISIAGIIKEAPDDIMNKKELEEIIKKTWLDGSLSRQSLYNMAELIKIKINNYPEIINKIDEVLQLLENNFFITKRNDNYYGRLFETELSKFIIDHPNMNMLKVRDTISSFILDDFQCLSSDDQLSLCACLANRMFSDPPAWRDKLICANHFVREPDPECFVKMIKYSGKYSIPLILSVAVKYIISSQGTVALKNEATKYYIHKILPQRQIFSSLSDSRNIKNSAYGLLLPYQKNYLLSNPPSLGAGIRPIDKYMRPTVGVELNEHDAIALSNERTIGIGVSGSSNILNFLFKKLQLEYEGFPEDDAKLATASWLSYSGGHSFNEAYSVFSFMSQGSFKPLSFNELKTSSLLSEIAITHSYNKVVETAIALSN
ncbi:hypothetical protein [Citrobacter sp. JGM124]|uniref:hypothetical protein n=1 Tax=Citrobacter sp. JGM124 TaxID=2799789 RepID=UPI001BA6F8E3|nr:hypothetical protein [Citrobacter sp. JGM124]MBS0848406.1 hypothetical protein [Citrobacter sp. JGM124]